MGLGVPINSYTLFLRALLLFIQTLALYKSFTYLLTYLLTIYLLEVLEKCETTRYKAYKNEQ